MIFKFDLAPTVHVCICAAAPSLGFHPLASIPSSFDLKAICDTFIILHEDLSVFMMCAKALKWI